MSEARQEFDPYSRIQDRNDANGVRTQPSRLTS
jgi:hypothetical protein